LAAAADGEPRVFSIEGEAPLFAMAAAACVATALASARGSDFNARNVPFPERLANAFVSYAVPRKDRWPASLACSTLTVALESGRRRFSARPLVLTAITPGRFSIRKPALTRRSAGSGTWARSFRVIGLVQVGYPSMADRYTYVPLIGIFVAIAWGAGELAERSFTARSVVAAGRPARSRPASS